MLICGAAGLQVLTLLLGGGAMAFTTEPLIFMIVYVWSKHCPNDKVRGRQAVRVRAHEGMLSPTVGSPQTKAAVPAGLQSHARVCTYLHMLQARHLPTRRGTLLPGPLPRR